MIVQSNIINTLLEMAYVQQVNLSNIDKSFIRILPQVGSYSRQSVKEAMYYSQCAQIEMYEYDQANHDDKLGEAVDIAIFTLNVLAYLGCDPSRYLDMAIAVNSSTSLVLTSYTYTLAELLYGLVDYKQWKFTKQSTIKTTEELEIALKQILEIGFSLLLNEIKRKSTAEEFTDMYKRDKLIYNAIANKMQISIQRANSEVKNHNLIGG